MTRQAFEANLRDLITAIEVCLSRRLPLPALALIYIGIDTMAWLNRAEDHADVTHSDFIDWVDTFLLPGSGLACSSEDLYGARCGILHSLSAESRLYRRGEARRLYYAWGEVEDADLSRLLDRCSGAEDALAVHVNDLLAAFAMGIAVFVKHLDADVDQAEMVYSRAGKFFAHLSRATVEKAGQ